MLAIAGGIILALVIMQIAGMVLMVLVEWRLNRPERTGPSLLARLFRWLANAFGIALLTGTWVIAAMLLVENLDKVPDAPLYMWLAFVMVLGGTTCIIVDLLIKQGRKRSARA